MLSRAKSANVRFSQVVQLFAPEQTAYVCGLAKTRSAISF